MASPQPQSEPEVQRKARALALAMGDSTVFRRFEAAQEALFANADLSGALRSFEERQREVQMARAWGGARTGAAAALDAEWETLARDPTLKAFLAAQSELIEFLREVTTAIGSEVGVDYGGACTPAGGCC